MFQQLYTITSQRICHENETKFYICLVNVSWWVMSLPDWDFHQMIPSQHSENNARNQKQVLYNLLVSLSSANLKQTIEVKRRKLKWTDCNWKKMIISLPIFAVFFLSLCEGKQLARQGRIIFPVEEDETSFEERFPAAAAVKPRNSPLTLAVIQRNTSELLEPPPGN